MLALAFVLHAEEHPRVRSVGVGTQGSCYKAFGLRVCRLCSKVVV